MEEKDRSLQQRACYKCGYHAITADLYCPRCRHGLETTASIRIRGLVSVLCGALLIPFVGYIALVVMRAMNSSQATGAQYTGTREQMLLIFALLGVIIAIGFAALVMGVWQMAVGRRSKFFVRLVVGLSVLLLGACGYFMFMAT